MRARDAYLAVGAGFGLIAGAVLWLAAAALPGAATGPSPGEAAVAEVLLYVQPGEDTAQVVEQLARAGLIRSADSFTARLVALHYDGRIQPGAYAFRRDIAEAELAQRLVHGP